MDEDVETLRVGKRKEHFLFLLLLSSCAIESACYGGRVRGAGGEDSGLRYFTFAGCTGQIR